MSGLTLAAGSARVVNFDAAVFHLRQGCARDAVVNFLVSVGQLVGTVARGVSPGNEAS